MMLIDDEPQSCPSYRYIGPQAHAGVAEEAGWQRASDRTPDAPQSQ